MMVAKRVLPVLVVCLSFVSFAEAFRSSTAFNRTRPDMRALDALRQAVAQDREREIRASISGETPDAGDSFGLEQQSFIREWFSRQGPRAQQGERVTPSLERDEILPAELRQRFQPLPFALERQLPILARNLRRGIIVGDVVLLDEETSRIVDLIHGVLK